MDADAAFISLSAATYIASTNTSASDPGPSRATLSPDEVCLRSLNAFLDYFLAMILQDAKSVDLKDLQATLTQLLNSPLGHVALQEASAELETYKSQAAGQGRILDDELNGKRRPSNQPFNVEAVWAQARVRCMVYSTIGEKEENDFPPLPEDENSVTPPVAIFLTAILEFLGEHILFTTARFARSRLGEDTRGTMTHVDLDQGIRTDTVLAALWSDYWEIMPASMQQQAAAAASTTAASSAPSELQGQKALSGMQNHQTIGTLPFTPGSADASPGSVPYNPSAQPAPTEAVSALAAGTRQQDLASTPVVMRKQSPALHDPRNQPQAQSQTAKPAQPRPINTSTLTSDNVNVATSPTATMANGSTFATRKGVQTGLTQARHLASTDDAVSNVSAPIAEPGSDFDAFLRYERLREEEAQRQSRILSDRDREAAEEKRARIVAQREAALASQRQSITPPNDAQTPAPKSSPTKPQQQTQPTTPGRAGPGYIELPAYRAPPTGASPMASPSGARTPSNLQPRDATGSPVGEQTLRLAAFLRNTAPPGSAPASPLRETPVAGAPAKKSIPIISSPSSSKVPQSPSRGTTSGTAITAPESLAPASPAPVPRSAGNANVASPQAVAAAVAATKKLEAPADITHAPTTAQRVKARPAEKRQPIESSAGTSVSEGFHVPTTESAAEVFVPDNARAESLADFLFGTPAPPAAVAHPSARGAEIIGSPTRQSSAYSVIPPPQKQQQSQPSAPVSKINTESRQELLRQTTPSRLTTIPGYDRPVGLPLGSPLAATAGAKQASTGNASAPAPAAAEMHRDNSIARIAHEGKRSRFRMTALSDQRAVSRSQREEEDALLAEDSDDELLDYNELLTGRSAGGGRRGVESLAEFLRSTAPPGTDNAAVGKRMPPTVMSVGGNAQKDSVGDSLPSSAANGPKGSRLSSLGRRISSLSFQKRTTSTSSVPTASDKEYVHDTASTAAASESTINDKLAQPQNPPSRPTHRPLIPSTSDGPPRL
ncbi:hypothetical protein PYCC9005_001515 [Savitreella phatthalungensis]